MKSDAVLRFFLLLSVFVVLVAWEIAGYYSYPMTIRWGYPSKILGTIIDWMLSGYIWPHIWSTLSITLVGMALGLAGGIGLAFMFYLIPTLDAVFTPLMAWLNSLPRILLVPIFIASLGIGISARLMMVVVMTIFLFFFNVLIGLKSIDSRIIINARLLGARPRQLFRYVYVPLLTSWLISVLRPALGFALIGAIISEYFGATSGIGYVVDLAYGRNRFDDALAGLLIVFIAAGLLDTLVRIIEQWLVGNPIASIRS